MSQRAMMKSSCDGYDAGNKWEGLRLATCVFNLVHDHGSITSILSQLDAKHKIVFMSSGRRLTNEHDEVWPGARYTLLIEFERYRQYPRGTKIPEFVPLSTFYRSRGQRPIFTGLPFEDWWETDIIFFDERFALTRKRLVFTLRNQEGGSHFDPEMRDQNYLALRNPIIMITPGLGLGHMDNLELATMRQIAEELRMSLHMHERLQHLRLGE
jgi:hypothetical protein